MVENYPQTHYPQSMIYVILVFMDRQILVR